MAHVIPAGKLICRQKAGEKLVELNQ